MRYRLAMALLAWLFGVAASLSVIQFDNFGLEGYAEGLRQRQTSGLRADPQIVLAGLDETALSPEYYNRAVHAQVLDSLTRCGARLVFFDLIFDENRSPEFDTPLLESLMKGPPVILAGTTTQLETEQGIVLQPPRLAPNLQPALETERVVLGSIERAEDQEGTVWPYFLAIRYESEELIVPSAALASFSLLQSVRPSDIRYLEAAVEVPPFKIPVEVQSSGEIALSVFDLKFHQPATGPGHQPGPETYRVIPYLDLLSPDDELRASLRNSIVVIGENTATETDLVITPVGQIKGFEAHAQCLDRLIHRDFYTTADNRTNLTVSALLTGLIAFLALLTWPMPVLLLIGPSIIAAYVWGNFWLFQEKHLILALAAPVAGAAIALSCLILVRAILASRFLGRFIPKEAARGILMARDTAEATEATVIVTDIRGYTTLSETRTPVEMLKLLNEYHSVTVDIYHKHGGNVLTFQGDAQLVVFGYPRRLKDPVGAAVEASVEVMQAIDDLRTKWGISERKNFDVGAGICTGLVYIGDIGSREQANYTVIGEVVRTSHKVQSMSDALEGNVLMDEPSYEACLSKPHVTAIPDVMLEGFPEPKTLYRVERD